MSTDQGAVDASTVERTRQQIAGIIQEVAQLSRENLDPEEYYAEVLQRVVTALAAIGGAVWTISPERSLRLEYHINLSKHLVDPQAEASQRHLRLLQQVIQTGEARLVPPLSGGGDPDSPGNPTNSLLVLAPLKSEDAVEGVLEVFQRPDAQAGSQPGFLKFLVRMSEHIGDWLRARKLRHFSDRQSLWSQIDRFAKEVHHSLDVRETAYTIANEGRRLIGCDRVSVAVRKGGKQQVEAISGQDTMENRSNTVTMLSKLAQVVCKAGEPLWYTGASQDLPPQIERALHDYVDESHSKAVIVVPLRKVHDETTAQDELGSESSPDDERLKGEVIGALIVEQIDSVPRRELLMPRVDLVCQHSARAMNNAIEHNSLFLMPLWRTIGKSRWLVQARNLPKTIAVALGVLAGLIALAVWPADYEMKAKGELLPIKRQKAFFAIDGEVEKVLVDHGDSVEAGQVLIELNSDQLQEEITKTTNQIGELRQQGLGLRSQQAGAKTSLERSRISTDLLSNETKIEGLKRELEIYRKEAAKLKIVSPITGSVATWNLRENLQGRPVMATQEAVEIVDPSGDWELVVYMPEDQIGHVMAARESLSGKYPGGHLPVSYVLEMNPEETLYGDLEYIQLGVESHEVHGPASKIRVKIKRDDLPKAKSGTKPGELTVKSGSEVTARVYCGRRPIGYVWFHKVWEWLQKNWLF
ncbi:MAG: GAF domain-containing protein [Pirellulales bacterium]